MKKIFLYVAACLLAVATSFAQDKVFEPSGKVTSTLFFNYHYDFTEGVERKSQFELLRAYLGYNYAFSEAFTGKVLFDVGHDGKTFAAFLKTGSLEWRKNKYFALETGMMSTNNWDTQEKLWGYRYISSTLQDKYAYYSSADLGLKATISPLKMLDIRVGVWNGEGFRNIQDGFGVQKVSFDAIVRPVDGLTVKVYYDRMPKRDTAANANVDNLQTQGIINFFAGYEKKDLFRVGVEYDIMQNAQNKKDQQLNGISAYASFIVKKFEIFARFDQLASNKIGAATDPWNINKDENMILAGVQYSPVKGVRTALNFRHTTPKKSGVKPMDLLYVNVEYKF